MTPRKLIALWKKHDEYEQAKARWYNPFLGAPGANVKGGKSRSSGPVVKYADEVPWL